METLRSERPSVLLALTMVIGVIASCPSRADQLSKVYDVPPIAQSKDNSCWAAAAAMLLSWQRNIPTSELDVATQAGGSFLYAYNADSGLFGSELGAFASAMNLVTEAPQNYMPQAYYEMLSAHGPLWVGTAIFSSTAVYRHVRIVSGIDGDGSYDGTVLHIVDPAGGRTYDETVAEFETELETIAQQDLGADGTGNLYPQVIHLP